ncbi:MULTISPECIES: hypothetical protein [Brevibacterium]|jgi:hypothetical protein|uniref:ABC transporter permease n=1 Tax=Brevibacterium salitolerans TaxID=1403566 RepID=A0ABP5INS4_9MICO|nr:hypothetical protein [Brevibacterium sp.]
MNRYGTALTSADFAHDPPRPSTPVHRPRKQRTAMHGTPAPRAGTHSSASAAHAPTTLSRVLGVVRLQYLNSYIFVWVPLIVLSGAIVISLAVYWMIGSDEPMYGGGSQAALWYFLVVGVQAMTLTFPFSQAMSLARREFFLGTLLASALAAAGLAAVYVLLGLLERATDGYGINGYIAYLPWIWQSGWASGAALVFVMVMLFFIVGFWFSTLYRSLGTTVLTLVIIGLALCLLVVVFAITRLEAWPEVVSWVAQLGPLSAAGVLGLLVVVLGAGSWLTLRRSVP